MCVVITLFILCKVEIISRGNKGPNNGACILPVKSKLLKKGKLVWFVFKITIKENYIPCIDMHADT